MNIEKIIDRIRAVPTGVDPKEVYEKIQKDYPDLSTYQFFLCWKAAEILDSIS